MRRVGKAGWPVVLGGLLAASLMPSPATAQNLTVADVTLILGQAQAEATARGAPATITITDRVGNVLANFIMNGAPARVSVTTNRGIAAGNGLERIEDIFVALGAPNSPSASLSSIAKAITGSYLSSGGNAFTTRTASQIVQEHFNPGESFSPSGPLFGVQFTQLPCSDLSIRLTTNNMTAPVIMSATAGPKRSPLGMSADPGGLPLYKNGSVVGGIGVESDGIYTLDPSVGDFDADNDEIIAFAGQTGFEPPVNIQANRIFVEGKSLRYTDVGAASLAVDPAVAPVFMDGVGGNLTAINGYGGGAILAGQTFGTVASGIIADSAAATPVYGFVSGAAFVLTDGTNNTNRFQPMDSVFPTTGAGGLTANEVTTIIGNALNVAFSGRAQIRRPLDSPIQVTATVVDLDGNILGLARTPDGPLFGTDTAVQKARTATFFSSFTAGTYLQGYDVGANGLTAVDDQLNNPASGTNALGVTFADFVTAVRAFVGATALADGIAFSDRSGGNLSRPFYPDGVDNASNGPFSRPFATWSPFNTGLQLDSVLDNIAQHILFADAATFAGAPTDSDATCSFFDNAATSGGLRSRIANGFQIFPGSVPIFRNAVLIGGLGVSGDGIDQDDMISFLGLHNGGLALGTGVGHAPPGIRADTLVPGGARLRYVNCPYKPFIGSSAQNVCSGK